jgi:signal transduction histidine kinase/FixJ family two-component response regulator
MSSNHKPIFYTIKSKVVIAFLFAALALMLAWGVSKFVFGEILGNLQEISAPNNKLRLVNKLSHQIASLDYLQRNQNDNVSYFAATQKLRKSLDTLSKLYEADTSQLRRIKTLEKLLQDRDKQYLLFLDVKENLVSTQSYSEELDKLVQLLSQRTRNADSAVFTTQTSTSTTTLAPEDQQKSRGFLSRLFGKKKSEIYKIIEEEYKIKRDTINPEIQDSVINSVATTLKNIEDEQRKKGNRFLIREAELASSSAALTKEMLNVLNEVETEALLQMDKNELQAKSTVAEGVFQIKVIIIVFFAITLLLGSLILIDISRNNKYRLALEKAKDEAEYHGKAKQRFLSNMSHEIRTPLQSILGYAELVAQEEYPDKKHLSAIHQSSIHLLQIVNEVLDFNRITSGEFSFKSELFNLQKLLAEVVEAVRPMVEKKGLQLITNVDFETSIWLQGDAFRLKQVLYNLLGNAIKFTTSGYVKLVVEVKQEAEDAHCYFTVEDTGIGFAEKDSDKIFRAFEQSATAPHQSINQSGTGLGLAIVKTLVDAQQGRITTKSQLGKGASFVVYLKFPQADAPSAQATDKVIASVEKPNMVWVVDDDRLITDLCEIIFNRNQIPFKIFHDGRSILAEPTPSNLDYVLVDMRLEDTTGLALLQTLKLKLDRSVKFYAMTAQVLPDEQESVLAAGFEKVLMKPFKSEDLLSVFGLAEIKPEQDFSFDQSALLKMTMGDRDMVAKILTSFIADCKEDEVLLSKSIANDNVAEARLVVHRLAGRVAQIGAKDLGAKFRMLEQFISKASSIDKVGESKIEASIAELNNLLNQIEGRPALVHEKA